jgi:hypothetical protein
MKQKLKLDPQDLAIEQFEVDPAADNVEGTVYGFDTVDAYTDPCAFCIRMPATARCDVAGS